MYTLPYLLVSLIFPLYYASLLINMKVYKWKAKKTHIKKKSLERKCLVWKNTQENRCGKTHWKYSCIGNKSNFTSINWTNALIKYWWDTDIVISFNQLLKKAL